VVKGDLATYEGNYWMENRGKTNLAISASDPTNPRIDRIIAEVLNAEYSGVSNLWQLRVMTGTPAGSPSAPALPNNAISLATVAVAALASSITNTNITDLRTRAWLHQSTITCTSTSRPASPFEGMRIYETNTDQELVYTGSAWVVVSRLGAWTDFSSSVVISQGATPTKTMTYCRYQKIGRLCTYQGYAQITSSGTLDTAISISLPFTAVQTSLPVGNFYWHYSGTATNWLYPATLSSTTALGGLISTTGLLTGRSSGSHPNQLLNGHSILWGIVYETTT